MRQRDGKHEGDVRPVCGDVVVADDSGSFRRALVRQLEVLGFVARGVDSMEDLARCLQGTPPRAVLLDWHFEGRTAARVLEQLRARWIPVIVLTGDPGGVGITGVPVLGKPVELALLRAQLEEVLAGAAGQVHTVQANGSGI